MPTKYLTKHDGCDQSIDFQLARFHQSLSPSVMAASSNSKFETRDSKEY
jgi:hypothetical protein